MESAEQILAETKTCKMLRDPPDKGDQLVLEGKCPSSLNHLLLFAGAGIRTEYPSLIHSFLTRYIIIPLHVVIVLSSWLRFLKYHLRQLCIPFSETRVKDSLEGDTVAFHSNLFFPMACCSVLKQTEILFKRRFSKDLLRYKFLLIKSFLDFSGTLHLSHYGCGVRWSLPFIQNDTVGPQLHR